MKVLQFLKTVYKSSFLAKIFGCIGTAYQQSILFSVFRAGELDHSLGNSSLISTNEAEKGITKGKILPTLYEQADLLLHISCLQFGILVFFFCLSGAIGAFLDLRIVSGFIFLAISLASVFLFFSKQSLVNVFSNCIIGRFFNINKSVTAQKQNNLVMMIIGALGIIGGIFLPFPYSIMLPMIPVLVLMLMVVKPIVVLCIIMVCLPLFGTSVCIILSIVLAISHWLQRFFGNVKKTKCDYVDILFAFYILLCLVSSLFSFAISDSLRVSLMWIVLFSTVFFVIRCVTTRQHLTMVLSFLLIGTVMASLIGLFQFLSGQVDTTWTDTTLFENLDIRIYSTFANPNVFGEFLLLVIPVAAGLGIYFDKWKYKAACFISLALALIALALTYSRGCYVGLAVTAVVFLWMYNKKILGILLVLGTPVGIMMLPQNMIDRIMSMVNLADSSTSYRLKIYEGSFELLKTYWPSGLGIGEAAFNYVYPFFGIQGIVAPHTHSLFLQLITSFGLVGLIYLMFLLFVYHRNIISLSKKQAQKDQSKLLLIIFGSVLSGFLVQSIFDYTWYNYRVYMLFWLIIALGISTYKIIRKEQFGD